MTNTKAVKALIKSKGIKLVFLAKELGISDNALYMKLDNRTEFRTGEVAKLCEILGITSLKEKERLFFAKKDDLKLSE